MKARPLEGKTALITGAGTGIGRAIAHAFGEAGAALVLAGRRKEMLENVRQEVERAGGTAHVKTADVAQQQEAADLVKASAQTLGRLDILVNNAGRTYDQLILRMKWDELASTLATNLQSMFYTCAAAGKVMIGQRNGSIVNLTSVVALTGNAGQSAYVASKAGVIGLTKSLAHEFGSRNVRVNAVAPGFIETDMTAALSDELKESYLSRVPLRRFGKPSDVASLVVFLASDEAAYITGQTLAVDGGFHM